MGTDRASRAMRRSRRFHEHRWRFYEVRERLGEREQIARLDVGARHRIADGVQAIGQQIHHRRNRYVVVQDYQGDAVTGEPPIPARHQIGRAARDPIASGAADNATRIAAATRSAVPAETAVPRWVRGRPALVRRRRWQPK
jgi:hypothetical protein